MKTASALRTRCTGTWGAGLLVAVCLTTPLAFGSDYGRVSGTVEDPQGNPLMGATVLIIGPVLGGSNSLQPKLDRILTDAKGKFVVEHLLPGWYSLRVTSATRVPALRNGIKVEAGQTAQEKFILSDIFAPLRIQLPPAKLSTWGDDWKWVLRTSASTRPAMRFVGDDEDETATSAENYQPPLPPGQRLIGMMPGSTRREALEGDTGTGSILAYLRPLSADADLLVAGEMTADGSIASSLVTALRRNMIKGDPQELTLAVHQLSLGDGIPFVLQGGHEGQSSAQALSASYRHTRRISDSVTVTTGLELDYLNAGADAMTLRPSVKVEYQQSASNTFALRVGSSGAESNPSLMERVGEISAFPRITMLDDRPRLESLNHVEASFDRKLGKESSAQVAVYRDEFTNTAVWGIGDPSTVAWLAGNVLPNAHVNGLTLNAGNYSSTGLRAALVRSIGDHVETAVVYTTGSALTVRTSKLPEESAQGNLREVLSNDQSHSVTGKVIARIPRCKTQITTSYQWVQKGRVTGLDPLGQANWELEPFLGIQIRQPLPAMAFLPAHIEALADFRNLLAQGYVPVSQGGESLILTPSYRSFRGGFSVQF